MPVLYMQTDMVRDLGQQIHGFTANSDDGNGRLSSSLQNLASSWQGGSSEHFQGEMQSVLSQMRSLSNEAETLRTRLLREVDEWERVDHRFGAGSVLGITFPDLGWQLPRIDIPKLLPIVGLLPFVPFLPLPFLPGVPNWLADKLTPLLGDNQPFQDPHTNPPPSRTSSEGGTTPKQSPPEQRQPPPSSEAEKSSPPTQQESPNAGRNPSPVALNDDIKPGPSKTCAEYAQQRRSDLGRTENGSAYSYIDKFDSKVFQVDPSSGDLRNQVAEGYALVWEPGQQGADNIHGHVAIVEQVGSDYVVISESGWAGGTERRIPLNKLAKLHIIP